MPNYRSLVGGYFSATPFDKSSGPVSIRMNNPGAVNGAAWERTYPGYVSEIETTRGNRSTIFETPEQGVAAWWDLLRRYREKGVATVGGIITRYGGGQDYSAYLEFVLKRTGFAASTIIDLDDDQQLLRLGRAMFRYEAGREIPWRDAQILRGFGCGRSIARTGSMPATAPAGPSGPALVGQVQDDHLPDAHPPDDHLLDEVARTLAAALGKGSSASATAITTPILSSIDKLFGGEMLTGKKTALSVVAYAVLAILEAAGVVGAATPAGQILSVLTIAFGVLGGVAKVDRMIQILGVIAAKPK